MANKKGVENLVKLVNAQQNINSLRRKENYSSFLRCRGEAALGLKSMAQRCLTTFRSSDHEQASLRMPAAWLRSPRTLFSIHICQQYGQYIGKYRKQVLAKRCTDGLQACLRRPFCYIRNIHIHDHDAYYFWKKSLRKKKQSRQTARRETEGCYFQLRDFCLYIIDTQQAEHCAFLLSYCFA